MIEIEVNETGLIKIKQGTHVGSMIWSTQWQE